MTFGTGNEGVSGGVAASGTSCDGASEVVVTFGTGGEATVREGWVALV